ncbi:MAG: hypothetical protein QM765_44565 [Myxococcales bacterium]
MAPVIQTVPANGLFTFQLDVNDTFVTASSSVNVQVYMVGDINHDWNINVNDLVALVGAWNTQGASLAADLNVDTRVNIGDLQILVANYGRHLP